MNDTNLVTPSALAFREIHCDPALTLSLASWWNEWAKTRPNLFNGPLIACQSIDAGERETEITWYRTSYAHYLQREARPPITAPARALFCSVALVSRMGSLLIGQMSAGTSSPLRLQLPGGNIDLDATGGLSAAHCAAEAARELSEETGVSVKAKELQLWRVKTGGEYDDVGLIYVCRSQLSDDTILEAFAHHQHAAQAQGATPEFEQIVLARAPSFRLDEDIACVDYLPAVTTTLAGEIG